MTSTQTKLVTAASLLMILGCGLLLLWFIPSQQNRLATLQNQLTEQTAQQNRANKLDADWRILLSNYDEPSIKRATQSPQRLEVVQTVRRLARQKQLTLQDLTISPEQNVARYGQSAVLNSNVTIVLSGVRDNPIYETATLLLAALPARAKLVAFAIGQKEDPQNKVTATLTYQLRWLAMAEEK